MTLTLTDTVGQRLTHRERNPDNDTLSGQILAYTIRGLPSETLHKYKTDRGNIRGPKIMFRESIRYISNLLHG